MKRFLKFKLNNQLFGEGDGNSETKGNPSQNTQQPNNGTIDYSKIEEIINKRSSSTADSVLKGYLKEQGLTGDELTQAVKDFKNQKEEQAKQAKQEQEKIKLENQQLKAQILNASIDSKLTSISAEEGIKTEKVPFLLKLVDRTSLSNEKGEINEEKCKEAINNVLKAFPDFKSSNQNNGFQQIGGAGNQQRQSSTDEQLDAIFGIKKK